MSKQTLIIVESPSKCKKIENILGKKYKVIASYGHFTKLDDLSQINFENFEIDYKIDNKKVLKTMIENIKNSDEVIIGTDDDREGEAIGWTICKFCNLDPNKTKKMVFQEITKSALTSSLDNLGTLNRQRIQSQQTRQILDIYLGYSISPVLWKFVKHKLSAGRCQTPALRLIYDNSKKIESMSNDTNYHVSASFTEKRIVFKLTKTIEKEYIDDFVGVIKDKMNKDNKWWIHESRSQTFSESPPHVLITSTLQQKAYNLIKMSTKSCMKCAQELYENGLITYMRTDSSCYSKEFVEQLKNHIQRLYGNKYVHVNIDNLCTNKNKSKSQEAHEGIRVCDLSVTESNLGNASSNRLYKFIYKHTIQSGMSNSNGFHHEFMIKYDENTTFKYVDKEFVFDGWKCLENNKPTVSYKTYLQNLSVSKQIFSMNFMECFEKSIHSICHLNEASLVQQLEKMNIGRPSTFSSIVQGLQDKKYVNKGNVEGRKTNITNFLVEPEKQLSKETREVYLNSEKSKLMITPIGKQVIEFCYEYFDNIFQYDFTNSMEEMLDNIENNNLPHIEVLQNYIHCVNVLIEKTKDNFEKHPETIKKVKDASLYCGNIEGEVAYIKCGKYGYYLNYGKDKISLNEFSSFDISEKINKGSPLTNGEQMMLQNYLKTRNENRKSNILVKLSDNCSIRKSQHGVYIYYKTKKMKQPKFMKYNDENDDKKELRNSWVTSQDYLSIKKYLIQKYNIIV